MRDFLDALLDGVFFVWLILTYLAWALLPWG